MTTYHVGCGIAGIYAGTLNKTNTMWVNKSDVTDEAVSAVAQFLLEHDEAMEFSYHGKPYRLAVVPQGSEQMSMKIKDYKCECGHNNFFFAKKNNQIGIYCSYCGRWLKWTDKNEKNLVMKQEPVLGKILDKIRADIKIDSQEMLNVINKYRFESEE